MLLMLNSLARMIRFKRPFPGQKNVAVTKVPILIVGEIGVGKRSLGKFVHENSSRKNNPVLSIDCLAEPKDGGERYSRVQR